VSEKITSNCMRTIGLVVCVIGISGALHGDPMLLVVSLVLGCIAGETLGIESGLNSLGEKLQQKFARKKKDTGAGAVSSGAEGEAYGTLDTQGISRHEAHSAAAPGKSSTRAPSFTEGFVTATLLFCVGAMTVVGSIESGLTGDRNLIITKSILDCIGAMILASTFGLGVLFSAAVILLYQGGIEFFAGYLQGVLTEPLITQISAVGSVMILALGLNMSLSAGIRAANLLPGFLFAAGYYLLFM
jgi:hypothetical protein